MYGRHLGMKEHFNTKHGHAKPASRSSTYRSWECMRSRCNNPNNPDYKNYGARGIKVCKRWDSYENFLYDMGERPTGTTLHRINNNGNYCKTNCKWADSSEQSRNKNNNRLINHNNKLITLIELSEITKIKYSLLYDRIVRRKWSVEKAISKPLDISKRHKS